MRRSIIVGLVLASFAGPVLANPHSGVSAGKYRHHVYHRSITIGPFVPYPPGVGDTDGLSRRLDDCNKGCIGGNPL